MVQRRGLQEHVIIHHELWPAQELPGLIRTADLGIVPYRNDTFSDGLLPTKLMEYAALGLPCVGARTSAIESYFGDTMTALFEPGDLDALVDCLRKLYNSPQRMAELAKGTQRFNERYNWTKIGSDYVRLVESLAGKTSPALSRSIA